MLQSDNRTAKFQELEGYYNVMEQAVNMIAEGFFFTFWNNFLGFFVVVVVGYFNLLLVFIIFIIIVIY